MIFICYLWLKVLINMDMDTFKEKAKEPINEPVEPNSRRSYKLYLGIFWGLFSSIILFLVILFYSISDGKLGFMPSFEELENPKNNLASEIYSSDRIILGTYFKENRSNISYDKLSPHLVNALIATEDIRFHKHSGIDIRALMRVISGVATGQSKGGGSTITQQLAKMLFPRENFKNKFSIVFRKLREWAIAVKLEKRYTKNEILTMYFNKFDFLNLAVGVKSAAKVYFNVTPDSLKIEQAAMLVGMAKNPSLFNPLRRPDTTLHRRNVVFSQMLKYNYINQVQFDSLKQIPLELEYQKVDHKLGIATYFREYLRMNLNAHEPKSKNYYRYLDFERDSVRWIEDPMYGWCNKNKKTDSTYYNLYRDGLRIYTTLNSKMQRYAEEAVQEHLGKDLQPNFFKEQKGRTKAPFSNDLTKAQIKGIMKTAMRRSSRYHDHRRARLSKDSIETIFNTPTPMKIFTWNGEVDTVLTPMDSMRYYKHFFRAGIMSMEPHTGYVRAYVGGPNYKHFQYNHVSQGKRQVGSTFKPFLYTLAMQEGISPCYKVPNVPTTFVLPNGQEKKEWTPKNSGNTKYDGKMVTLKWGLANSINYISAWLMNRFKPQSVVSIAKRMGITSDIIPVPAICLGVTDISLHEMVGAFNTFPSKGVHVDPVFVTRIEDKYGNVLATFVPDKKEAISEKTAYLMTNLLQNVVYRGTAIRLRLKYGLKNEIAGKTGTTQNQSDGWFMGFVPKLTTGIWVGCEDRAVHFNSIALGQGANMALPIWALYMQKVYADSLSLDYSIEDKFELPFGGLDVNVNCDDFGAEDPAILQERIRAKEDDDDLM